MPRICRACGCVIPQYRNKTASYCSSHCYEQWIARLKNKKSRLTLAVKKTTILDQAADLLGRR